MAADEVVEKLVRAADFDVAPHFDGIAPLQERIQKFDDGNRRFRGVALGEVVAFEHPRDGHLAGKLQRVEHRHFAEPLAVAAHFGLFGIENFERLVEVGFRVLVDFLFRQNRASGGTTGRIADARREVADDEHRLVTELLKLAQLVEDDHVPEREVGARRIDAELHAEFFPRLEAFKKLFAAEEDFGALFQKFNLSFCVHRIVENYARV